MYGTVTSATAFMTSGGEICDELLHGMSFRVIENLGGKFHIETDYGYRGDISERDVILHDDDRNSEDLRMVSGMFADVLYAPSVRSGIIITLVRGCAVRLIGGDENGFSLIELAGGARGYIRSVILSEAKNDDRENNEHALRKSILNSAAAYTGTQYRWGGKSPMGIDCSGLCFMAYRENGITVYRDAILKPGYALRQIPREQMKPA
ncbi:MAG: C40 family peptidase, partial [Defluviitaleaceae bacterium]|nr:C40 family peptidase [Defluviitaleaceae bacterium]